MSVNETPDVPVEAPADVPAEEPAAPVEEVQPSPEDKCDSESEINKVVDQPEELKEQPKEESKEQSKEQPKDQPKEEVQEVTSSTKVDEPPRAMAATRRSSYQSSRPYGGGFQNYGLTHLPYKSNFEPSEDARRRADEFFKTLKL